MPIRRGTHKLGPAHGTLSVRTGKTGAASKAGHDLLIEVAAWQATLEIAEDAAQSTLALHANATSLRVREGKGGMQALGDDDRSNIQQTIDDEVLKRQDIEFRSTAIRPSPDGARLSVDGELTLNGRARPIAFDLDVADDGRLRATAKVRQSDWDIKPYSTLFGALKVLDEVDVEFDAGLPPDSDQSR